MSFRAQERCRKRPCVFVGFFSVFGTMAAGAFYVLRRRPLKRLCELAADEINGARVFSGLRRNKACFRFHA